MVYNTLKEEQDAIQLNLFRAYTDARIETGYCNKLGAITGDIPEEKWDKEDLSDLFHSGIRHYISTIRGAIRYANTFALKYSLLKDETNLIDYIGLTYIKVFEPETYSKLPFHEKCLCGSSADYGNQYQQAKDEVQRTYGAIRKEREYY